MLPLPVFVCSLSVGEEEGWWVVVCCPQYVVMEDLVIQKECPPGQTGTIIDLFGIRRLHSLECWSGCWWIHRVGLCSHCSWQHTRVCSFLLTTARFLCFSAQCEPQKLQSVWKWQNTKESPFRGIREVTGSRVGSKMNSKILVTLLAVGC